METMNPLWYMSNPDWFLQQNLIKNWTTEENKQFERALAIYDKDTKDRWFKVAAMIPGKTVFDVEKQYKELEDDVGDIEAGLVPDPGYMPWELVDNCKFDGFGKRSSDSQQERKKGVPWTKDEHRRFLVGLQEYGKGDWRNISRYHVKTKTATQVASHAQKYFIRQLSVGKDNKRRPSIHDITTDTVSAPPPPPSDNLKSFSLHESAVLPTQKPFQDMNPLKNGEALMVFSSTRGNLSVSEMVSNGLKLQGENMYDIVHSKAHDSVFQIHSTRDKIR